MGYPKRLARAKSLAAGWDNYVNYLNNIDDRQDKVGSGTAKPPTISVYINPFTLNLGDKVRLQSSANQATHSAIGALANTYAPANLTAGDTAVKIKGFKPARVVRKTGITARGTRAVSKRTKLPYLNYGGDSGSIAFGKGGTTKSQQDVFEEFKALATTASTRFTLVPEKS